VLPQEKASEIRKLQGEGLKVAMVAMGLTMHCPGPGGCRDCYRLGTDVANETGHIILVKDDLLDVVAGIQIGGRHCGL
jgi:Cu+-exporting ATPase